MKKIQLLILIAAVFSFTYISAQPTGYYNGAAGKKGEELKSALNDIISGHTVYSYFFSKEIFKQSDADPNNPSNVIMVYTGRSHANDDYGNGGDQLNREHIWAKSHGNFLDKQPMYGDVHNLKPIDASVNQDKSNLDYDNGGTQHAEATGCYFTDSTWEPRDEVKGDVARIIFYMDTRYQGENGELDLTAVDEVNTYPYPKHGRLSTLLQWNLQDPPDDFERNRNNVIYSYQHNRNPFIDNPNYAELIWHDAALSPITIANIHQSPLVPHEGDPITISADVTSSLGNVSDAVLHYGYSWGSFSESVDMDINGNSIFADIPGQNQGTTVYFQIEAQVGSNTVNSITYNFYVPKTFTGDIVSIYDIQGQTDVSPYATQTVSTTGIVTANFGTSYFIQNGSGAWNGLYVYDPGRNPSVGDSLVLTGTVSEYYEKTELGSITGYYFISSNHQLPAAVNISCAEALEPYESVLIQVDNALCTDANYQANFFMWTVNDGTADLLVHNTSVFEYVPTEGEAYVVTGPLNYDFDEWKVELRFETDVQSGVDITAPQITSVEVITPTIVKVQFSEELDSTSAQNVANYSINNGIIVEQAKLHAIIKSQVFLTTSSLPGGDYELTVQNVADLVGNVMESTLVPFSSSGVKEINAENLMDIYPNPSNGVFNIELKNAYQENIVLNVYQIAGKKVFSKQYGSNNLRMIQVNAGQLSPGLYIVELMGDTFISRSKMIIR